MYDLIVSSGLYAKILEAIPGNEHCNLMNAIKKSIDAIYAYQNSVMGVLDTITSDYSNLNLNASEIQKKLADPENMDLLQEFMELYDSGLRIDLRKIKGHAGHKYNEMADKLASGKEVNNE
mgnify:CR=1 FL=1